MFDLREIKNKDIRDELSKIGFDNSYIDKAKSKFKFLNIKIYNLTCPQANILKQAALSVGAECATNKNVITGNIEKSDVILAGSVSQLEKIAELTNGKVFNGKNGLVQAFKKVRGYN